MELDCQGDVHLGSILPTSQWGYVEWFRLVAFHTGLIEGAGDRNDIRLDQVDREDADIAEQRERVKVFSRESRGGGGGGSYASEAKVAFFTATTTDGDHLSVI